MLAPKRKSQQRFEQANHLCDAVIRVLPTPAHGLVLLVGWRHADCRGVFRKSLNELSACTGLSKRQIQRIVESLVAIGALKVFREQRGTIPTSYLITGEPTARVDTDVHSKPTARVDTGDA